MTTTVWVLMAVIWILAYVTERIRGGGAGWAMLVATFMLAWVLAWGWFLFEVVGLK